MKPSSDDVMKLVQVAQLQTNTRNIAIGDKDDLSVTIRFLLRACLKIQPDLTIGIGLHI